MVSAEQQSILNFLQCCPDAYFSAMEISRKAGTRTQFAENPRWAINPLRHLLDMKLVERDEQAHYRIAPPPGENKDEEEQGLKKH